MTMRLSTMTESFWLAVTCGDRQLRALEERPDEFALLIGELCWNAT